MTAPEPRRRGRLMTMAGKARRGLLPRQTVITINVAGSVTTEQDLVRAVAKGLRGYGGQGLR